MPIFRLVWFWIWRYFFAVCLSNKGNMDWTIFAIIKGIHNAKKFWILYFYSRFFKSLSHNSVYEIFSVAIINSPARNLPSINIRFFLSFGDKDLIFCEVQNDNTTANIYFV